VGTSLGAAREQVRVGRALAELPHARAAFESGELSYSKVRAITRVATAELEENLVELAHHTAASQLEQLVREYRRADPEEAAMAAARHERRYLRTWTDESGMLVINARLSPEDGAIVLAAIEAAKAALADGSHDDEEGAKPPAAVAANVFAETSSPPDVSAETPEYGETDDPWRNESVLAELALKEPLQDVDITTADALVALCASVLARGLSEEIEDPHVTVVVHVDDGVLIDASAPGCAHVEGLGAITGHGARRFVCDGAVTRILFGSDGSIEQHGATRAIPRAMRRALLVRDRGCRWPGCATRRFLHAHHVVFWSNGGPTAMSNLLTLCGRHHRIVHEGGSSLHLERDGKLQILTPEGLELPAVPRGQPAEGDRLAITHRRMGLEIGSDTLAHGGERFDLGLTVDGLLSVVGRNEYRLDSTCVGS
jgi:hypothetical protein